MLDLKKTSAKQRLRGHFFDGIDNKRRHLVNCQKSGLDTVGSSISIVDLLRNDDASIDDWSSILRSSIYRVFKKDVEQGVVHLIMVMIIVSMD